MIRKITQPKDPGRKIWNHRNLLTINRPQSKDITLFEGSTVLERLLLTLEQWFRKIQELERFPFERSLSFELNILIFRISVFRKITLVRMINSVRRITVDFRALASKDSKSRKIHTWKILIFRDKTTIFRKDSLIERYVSNFEGLLERCLSIELSLIEGWSFDVEGYLSMSKDIFRMCTDTLTQMWRVGEKVMGW